MIERLVDALVAFGYPGIVLLMFLENIIPPIPAEVIMPLAGYGARDGSLRLPLVILSGTIGSSAGASAWYVLGHYLCRERTRGFLSRHGRWLTLSPADFDRAEAWFERHGIPAVFLGRLVPTIRTLISLPAGLLRMPPLIFLAWTILGTFVWMSVLATLGYLLAEEYRRIAHVLDPVAAALFASLLGVYMFRVWRQVSRDRAHERPDS